MRRYKLSYRANLMTSSVLLLLKIKFAISSRRVDMLILINAVAVLLDTHDRRDSAKIDVPKL